MNFYYYIYIAKKAFDFNSNQIVMQVLLKLTTQKFLLLFTSFYIRVKNNNINLL